MPGITVAEIILFNKHDCGAAGVTSILQLFMKAPVPGLVKTRLHPPLTLEQAACIHEMLCARLCETLCQLPGITTEVWAGSDASHPFFGQLQQQFGVAVHEQPAGDLGARMQATLQDGLRRSPRVLIVGGDCLSVDPAYVQEALSYLVGADRAVLGPAEDGGYVLVGAAEARVGMFADVAWGSDQALSQTLRNFRRLDYDVTLLASRWDIDTFADLQSHAPDLLESVMHS